MVLFGGNWPGVERGPEAMLLSVMLEGERLEIGDLVEREEVADDISCMLDEGGAIGQACMICIIPNMSKAGW